MVTTGKKLQFVESFAVRYLFNKLAHFMRFLRMCAAWRIEVRHALLPLTVYAFVGNETPHTKKTMLRLAAKILAKPKRSLTHVIVVL